MKLSAFKGFCFGLTSGIITTLGMIIGLNSSTSSKLIVLGGVLSIAIADSFSDALGIHVSEESDESKTSHEVWVSTFSTFISKLFFALTFVIPILIFDLDKAIIISCIWGLSVLALLSYFIAKSQKTNPVSVISEHLFIAFVVIVTTHYVGDWLAVNFN
ncbi:MAG: hypothetical protein Q7T50_03215 [Candidatus Magasanikbacteria bacterium]|nr:hypothetical protein [Candidatus Magasanikbacteria bacterium]